MLHSYHGSYHPDKPTGSVEKFRDIEKAYRILTDEIAKSNYERYGNPDGPSAVKVGERECVERRLESRCRNGCRRRVEVVWW